MAEQILEGGIVVRYPDGLRLIDSGGAPDAMAALGNEETGPDDTLLKEFADSTEFTAVTTIEISGAVDDGRLAAIEDEAAPEEVVVRIPLEDDESAVLLGESDGVFRWEYPEQIVDEEPDSDAIAAAPGKTQRVAVFRSPYKPLRDDEADPEAMGFTITDYILKPLRKLVLRFTARKAAEAIADFLERDVLEGPVVFTKDDDDNVSWDLADSFSHAWSGDQPRNVLLFVHGTFSSVDGSFGGLNTTDEGAQFLCQALDKYDAVIGFDHKTLTKTVKENAQDLLDKLDTLPAGDVTFDAVSFSRGGLVLRYLTEELLPSHSRRYQLRKGVFVGCTNNGTEFTQPKNWKTLIDLYTNLVAGAAKIVSKVGGPKTKIAAEITSGAMRGLLSFVRYVVSEGIDGEVVPGLASMNPDGHDVKHINQQQPGQPTPDQVSYYTIEADFDHEFFDDVSLAERGLSKRIFLEIGDGFVDQLFQGKENDLVVDQASMSHIDPWTTGWVQDKHVFGRDDGVYHTVYFNSDIVATKLAGWLV